MKRSYAAAWLGIFSALGLWLFWSLHGAAYVRRTYLAAPSIPEASRTQTQFVAVLIPRIRRNPERFVMSEAELTKLLRGLKDGGHVAIGLDDIEALYVRGRKLPPKALLIAFSENDQRGFQIADRALKRLGLRGAAFIQRTAEEAGQEHRQHLTRHSISQMRSGRAWEFGWTAKDAPPSGSPMGGRALLDVEGSQAPSGDPRVYPLRFIAAELGLNDRRDDPRALRMLALRTDRSPADNLQIVMKTWPRAAELRDDFRGDGIGTDWIQGWGVVSMGQRRLALLSTPRHTSAGVFLRGTEKWRDAAVEFVLEKYKMEFWAYARLREGGGFVRVGARDGWWYVEQKAGPRAPVNMLARAPIPEGGLPARVRFVVKDGSVIVHVNGRMQFGRALRLHPGVDHGQLFLGVYDARSRTSLAVLTSVRAAPLGDVWITTKSDRRGEFDEDRLDSLRDEAAYARALTPRWISAGPGGEVLLDERQSILIRSMAGFYACRLVATADLTGVRASVLQRAAGADRLADGLASAARELGSAGLNVRLTGEQAARPETLAFLSKLRDGLRSRGELRVTLHGAEPPEGALAAVTDGVLRRSAKTRQTLELLEAVYP